MTGAAVGAGTSAYHGYITSKLNPVLESLVVEILLELPEDPATFMISKLCQKVGLPDPVAGASGRKNEAEELKVEICLLREQIKELQRSQGITPTTQHLDTDDSEDEHDDDTVDDDEVDISKFKSLNKMRCSVSAEVYGEWNKKKNFVAPKYIKDEEQKRRLENILKQSFLFRNLDESDLGTVIDAMQEKQIAAENQLIVEGDDGDALYVVEQGELRCSKEVDGEEKVVKTVGVGDTFGELALLYNAPRAATVTSSTACTLWELGRDTFNAIIKVAANKRREMYDSFLKNVHLLESMDVYERGKVADALRTEVFTDGAYIVRQGEPGDTFYIVEEGQAVATRAFAPGETPMEVMKYGVRCAKEGSK